MRRPLVCVMLYNLPSKSISAENTHLVRKGKYHCTADLLQEASLYTKTSPCEVSDYFLI